MRKSLLALLALSLTGSAHAADLEVGAAAPPFTLKNQRGETFSLESRKGQWTVLYFYPKSETPGCTKQACAFRDGIQAIREQKAEVVGVSINSEADQAAFHAHHNLTFDLLADADGQVTSLYGARMPLLKLAKRWTFVLDPALKIRVIEKDVDPVKDASRMAARLRELQRPGA